MAVYTTTKYMYTLKKIYGLNLEEGGKFVQDAEVKKTTKIKICNEFWSSLM